MNYPKNWSRSLIRNIYKQIFLHFNPTKFNKLSWRCFCYKAIQFNRYSILTANDSSYFFIICKHQSSKSNSLKGFFHGFNNSTRSRNYSIFKIFGIWHRDINRCYSLNRSIKIIEGFSFVNDCSNFSSYSRLRESIFYSNQSVCLHNALDNSISIKGFNGSKIDYFTRNALFGENIGSLKWVFYASWISDNSSMLSFSHHFSLSDWYNVIRWHSLITDIKWFSIKIFIL